MRATALGLQGPALDLACRFENAFPAVVFTSGRRSIDEQAEAMACNVALNRKWIEQTYVSSKASNACQSIIDAHPEALNHANIAALILRVLRSLTFEEISHLTKHLAGEAFDCQPESVSMLALSWLKAEAAKLGGKVLTHEGGLWRVHCQA